MNKNKTHVCHLVYSFDVGGLERIIANCLNYLEQDKFTHTIISLTQVGEFISEINVPVEHYSLNKKPGNDISVYFRLYKLLTQLKPDVVHTYNLGTIEYQWVALLAGVPLRIHAEHGRDSYDPNGAVKKYQWIRRICSLAIHRVIAVSQDLKNWLSEEVKIPEWKLQLIQNGIDTQYYSPDFSGSPCSEFIKDKFVFGHVARLHAIKNQMLLLKAFQFACQKSGDFSTDCVLVLVGDGPDGESLKQFVNKEPQLKSRVMFAGAQSNVRDYYQHFDVFTMSSLAEGIPMTLLESMSMGIPHLVTSVGGIMEVVTEGETGLVVTSDDADSYTQGLLELYLNKIQTRDMSVKARDRIEQKFSQNIMMAEYSNIYTRHKGR